MSDAMVMATFGSFAVALGMVLASFCNVAIARIPEDRSVVLPRSHCPRCHAPIRARDNIPVISWLVLRGRCRDCDARISPTYPLIEGLGGLLALLLFWRIFPNPEALDLAHGAAFGVYLVFLCLLIVATYVDLRHWIIPDQTSIYAAPVGIGGAALLGALGYTGALGITWREAVLGSAFGGGFFAIAGLFAFIALRREGLGWGDVKLMAMIGGFLGLDTIGALFLGTVLGSIVGIGHVVWTGKRSYLPLGPSLAAGAAIMVIFGEQVMTTLFPIVPYWRAWLNAA